MLIHISLLCDLRLNALLHSSVILERMRSAALSGFGFVVLCCAGLVLIMCIHCLYLGLARTVYIHRI